MSIVAVKDWSPDKRDAQAPYTHAALVVPSDTDELTHVSKGISLDAAIAIAVVTADGDTLTIPAGALAAGVIHRLAVKQVKATGTGSGNVVAYW